MSVLKSARREGGEGEGGKEREERRAGGTKYLVLCLQAWDPTDRGLLLSSTLTGSQKLIDFKNLFFNYYKKDLLMTCTVLIFLLLLLLSSAIFVLSVGTI